MKILVPLAIFALTAAAPAKQAIISTIVTTNSANPAKKAIINTLPITNSAAQPNRGCLGTSQPTLSCETISAQAAIRQAQDADWQAYAAVAGSIVGALTLLAAVAAAIFAKRAADTADTSLTTIQNQFAIQTRPYLTIKVDNIEFNNLTNDGIGIRLSAEFVNCGATPAQGITAGSFMKAVCWPDYDKDMPTVITKELENFGAVFPKDPSRMRFEKTVSFDNTALSNQTNRICIIIIVKYKGFDPNHHFETEIHFTIKNLGEWIQTFRSNGQCIPIEHERTKGRDRAT